MDFDKYDKGYNNHYHNNKPQRNERRMTHTHIQKPVYESEDVRVLHNQGVRTGNRPDIIIETKMRKREN